MTVTLERADIEYFRLLVARRLGLHFENSRLAHLEDALRHRLEAGSYGDCSRYRQHLLSSQQEMLMLAEHLTVCETYFFRYAEHFRVFTEVVIPDRIRAQREYRKIRILSAGCASGEEAYSMAMLIREMFADLFPTHISIRGIDVNAAMVARALRARYGLWSLRDTPDELRTKYFRGEGRDLALDRSVKSMATFEQRNLAEEDPQFWQRDAFDVIFCRNVIMYFTPEAARSVISRIAQSLVPGGFLFLGHAETLRGISQEFHLRHTHETFYYQRREAHDVHEDLTAGRGNGASQRYVPALAAATDSWFDVIQGASERIATLTDRKSAQIVRPADSANAQAAKPGPVPLWKDTTRATELLRTERFAEAIELLNELPPGANIDPDVQLLLAVLLTNQGDLPEAERVCLHLLQLDELNAGAHYLIALCREHAGDPVAAAGHDQTAVYLDSTFAMPHLHLGLVAKRVADKETARRELGQAVALLAREDASRILLFGGGFTREALTEFCSAELRACGGANNE